MFIENKIKFSKDGLTVIQKIDQGFAGSTVTFVDSNALLDSYPNTVKANAARAAKAGQSGSGGAPFGSSSTGGAPFGSSSTGGAPFGSSSTGGAPFGSSNTGGWPFPNGWGAAPITVIGPIFFGCPCCEDGGKEKD